MMPPARQAVERGEGEVVAHRHRQHQAFGLAVLGDQRHADRLALRGARAGDRDRLAVDQHLAGHAAQHAEQRQQQLALALAVEAAEADHLAGARRRSEMSRSRSVQHEVAHFEHAARASLGARGGLRRKDVAVFAADHHLDDFVVGLGAGRVGRDVAAVAEHRAFVGQLGDLVHAVRDVEQRQAFGAQPLQHGEDLGHVGGGQRRGRLVEDQDARLARQRLGDLDHLPARQRQVLDQRQRMDVVGAGARQRLLGDAALRPAVDQCRSGAAGCVMTMLSATERSGISDSSWKMQAMPAALAAAGDAKRDRLRRRAACGPRRARRRPP